MTTREKINFILILFVITVFLGIGAFKDGFRLSFNKDTQYSVKPKEFVAVNKPESKTNKFYLVAGSFIDKENAEQYIDKMKKKGFEPILIPFVDSYFRVAIFSSPIKEEVVSYKNTLKGVSFKTWITYQ